MGSVSNGTGVAAEKVIPLKPSELNVVVAKLSSVSPLVVVAQLAEDGVKHNISLLPVVLDSKLAAVIAPLVTVKEFANTVSHKTALLPISKEPPKPAGKLVIKTAEAAPVLLSFSP